MFWSMEQYEYLIIARIAGVTSPYLPAQLPQSELSSRVVTLPRAEADLLQTQSPYLLCLRSQGILPEAENNDDNRIVEEEETDT